MNQHTFDQIARLLARGIGRRTLLRGIVAGTVVPAISAARFAPSCSALATQRQDGELVIDYYQAIKSRDYETAYGYLGRHLTSRQSLKEFTAGFADTVYVDLVVTASRPEAVSQGVVSDVSITAWHRDESIHKFEGTYVEGTEGGTRKLVDANTAEVEPESMPPLCAADDLDAAILGDAGAGQRYGTITVTNISAGACVLGGLPKVALRDDSGVTLITGRKEPDVLIKTVTLEHGSQAMLQVQWSNWCGAPITEMPQVSISFYGGKGTLTGLTGFGVPPCLSDPGGRSSLLVRPWQSLE